MYPVTVMTRIATFSVGNRYRPLFATVTGWGVDSTSICHTDGLNFPNPASPRSLGAAASLRGRVDSCCTQH